MTLFGRIGGAVLAAIGLVVVVVVIIWGVESRFEEARVQRTVIATLQQETPASFFVTGTLEIAITEEVERTEQLFPVLFALLRQAQPTLPGVNQATSRATVRVPGRVSYGFDVSELSPSDIRVLEGGVVDVTLPALRVYALEPYLEQLEARTEATGWMRLFGSKEDEVEREAIAGVRAALRQQGEVRLAESAQPRINTAKALEKLLRPALVAAGVSNPQFRFEIGDQLVVEPERSG